MALDMASIKARVKALDLFVQVHDVLSLVDAINNPGSVLKTAFVAIPKETAEPNRRDGGAHLQRITARVAISFPLKAQAVGMGRSDEVEAMRTTVKTHMAGWVPDGADTGLNYAYSDISQTVPGFVWVNVFFDCRYLMSAQPS